MFSSIPVLAFQDLEQCCFAVLSQFLLSILPLREILASCLANEIMEFFLKQFSYGMGNSLLSGTSVDGGTELVQLVSSLSRTPSCWETFKVTKK